VILREVSKDVGTELQLRPERPVRAKRPRLEKEAYIGRRTYHVTLTTNSRAFLLEDMELVRRCEALLRETSRSLDFSLLAYCFMPDHLHTLASGQEATSDLLRVVQRFKQRTGFEFKRQSGDRLWQQSFHDRVMRSSEGSGGVASYIFRNPVDAGLAESAVVYPFSRGLLWKGARADGAKAASPHQSSLRGNDSARDEDL
jgi:putative transposase